MRPWGLNPVGRAMAAALALAVPLGEPAGAGEVPENSVAASLLTPPELLDYPYLVHRYPERAAGEPAQVWTTAGSYGARAVGAVFGAGRGRVFVLSQDVTVFSAPSSARLAQIGGAWEVGPVRVGLALRGLRTASETESREERDDGRFEFAIEEMTVQREELAAGIGVVGEGFRADVAIQLFREELEARVERVSSYDTLSLELFPEGPRQSAVALRLAFPLAAGTRVRAAAGFEERSAIYDVKSETPFDSVDVRTDGYGHAWSAAVAVEKDVGPRSATIFARYGNERGPLQRDTGYSWWSELLRKREHARLGVSLRQPIWEEFELLAGFDTQFDVTRETRTSYRSSEVVRDITTRETLTQNFAWGLRRDFGKFDLAGSMKTDLQFGDPFFSVDARFRL